MENLTGNSAAGPSRLPQSQFTYGADDPNGTDYVVDETANASNINRRWSADAKGWNQRSSPTTTTAYEPPSSPTVQQRRNTLTRTTILTNPNHGPSIVQGQAQTQGTPSWYGTGAMDDGYNIPLGPSPIPPNGYSYNPDPTSYGVHPRSKGKSTTPMSYDPLSPSTPKKGRERAGSSSFLPSHRKGTSRQISSTWSNWQRIPRILRRRRIGLPFFIVLCGILLALYFFRKRYEIQLEFSVFSKSWIRKEIDEIRPLRGCFSPQLLSPEYNLTKHLAPRRNTLSPGIALRRGMSCYDFAATIKSSSDVPLEHITYHTYWRADLLPFSERQSATLISFLATQPLTHSKLILWTNNLETISKNEHVKPFIDNYSDYIQIRQVDIQTLTKGTELEKVLGGLSNERFYDQRGWIDGDAIRLLVLWSFGGIWMDMDELLTRDLHPLAESEWVTQWDCYDKPYFTLNGALMHFEKHSPYLCEAFHIMSTSPLPSPNTFGWGSHLYSKVHRALLAGRQKPFDVLPWCFADPRNCRTDNRFPDPFQKDPKVFGGYDYKSGGGRELLEKKVKDVWSIHLHNQWTKKFGKGNWVERLLEEYKDQLGMVEGPGQIQTQTQGKTKVFGRKENDKEVDINTNEGD